MDRPGSTSHTQRGSVRLALLCALAGAAAVFIWNARQPSVTQASTTSSQPPAGRLAPDATVAPDARAQPAAAHDASSPRGAAGAIVGDATPADVAATETGTHTETDADGFSADYGALVDEFQQQRALDPLVDE